MLVSGTCVVVMVALSSCCKLNGWVGCVAVKVVVAVDLIFFLVCFLCALLEMIDGCKYLFTAAKVRKGHVAK